jgi:pimeloyl-ACP methyl ester carboxylesterase
MWLECYGNGSPTIILEHGYDDGTASVWSKIIPQLAAQTQTCAYDRINAGISSRTSEPRTMAQAADELDALLKAAKIEGPYILAGHLFGGFFALTYANHNPEQVRGVVLVDSSYLDNCKDILKALPTPSANEARDIASFREECKPTAAAWNLEGIVDIDPAVRAVRSLGDIPLVVLAHGSISKAVDVSVGMPIDLVKQLVQRGQQEQKGYAKLSTDSTFMIAENSSHSIQNDEPQFVIDAIQGLVNKARQK